MAKSKAPPTAMNNQNMINLLHEVRVKSRQTLQMDYGIEWLDPRYSHHFPFFTYTVIPLMLRDPHIRFGLNMLKSPITTYTKFLTQQQADSPQIQSAVANQDLIFPFKIKAKNEEDEQYIVDQYNRFWVGGLNEALRAFEWGFSGSQIRYERDIKGRVAFHRLSYYKAMRTRMKLNRRNDMIGMYLVDTKQTIPFPKAFWHVHDRQENRVYGASRLIGAHVPWHETWTYGGARDIRRLWFFKNSFDSGILRFPASGATNDEGGNPVPNQEVAVTMMENRLSGAYFVLPNTKNGDGKDYEWEYEGPSAPVTPTNLMDYPKELKYEMLEGLGIPPEVLESMQSQGLGSSTGRMIPLLLYMSTLHPLTMDIIFDVKQQIIQPLLLANGMSTTFDVEPLLTAEPQETQPIEGKVPSK